MHQSVFRSPDQEKSKENMLLRGTFLPKKTTKAKRNLTYFGLVSAADEKECSAFIMHEIIN